MTANRAVVHAVVIRQMDERNTALWAPTNLDGHYGVSLCAADRANFFIYFTLTFIAPQSRFTYIFIIIGYFLSIIFLLYFITASTILQS